MDRQVRKRAKVKGRASANDADLEPVLVAGVGDRQRPAEMTNPQKMLNIKQNHNESVRLALCPLDVVPGVTCQQRFRSRANHVQTIEHFISTGFRRQRLPLKLP